jgi:hypothetical protein
MTPMSSQPQELGMDPLAFASAFKPVPHQDLLQADPAQVPPMPGAYILFARDAEFIYPAGKSSVFYIGQTDRLDRRLRQHRNKTREAKHDRQRVLYPLLSEYGAAFEGQFTFILAKDPLHPLTIELLLFTFFASQFRGLPVANSAVSKKKMQEIVEAARKHFGTDPATPTQPPD